MIHVDNLSVQAGSFSLQSISFKIPSGKHGVLMGKTGCGKTTILEAICGLKHVTSGHIFLMNQDVTRLKAAQRGIGYVPQDVALFSTMTVRDNLSFALRIRKWDSASIAERVQELSQTLGIEKILDRKPAKLSGGETQRVALGRALSFHPPILCLDEPFSALDDETKDEMYTMLKSIRERYAITTLHITHSMIDAKRLADRLYILKKGVVTEFPTSRIRSSHHNFSNTNSMKKQNIVETN